MKVALRPREWIWLPIVAVAVLVIYLPGLDNLPVFDDGYLADGELFHDYRHTLEFRARMLSYGSFVWVQHLLGDGWWKQRLVNVVLHLCVVASLWGLLRETLKHVAAPAGSTPAEDAVPFHQSPALGLAIGFFALNPVSVYAVAYLMQRSIVMATLFVVLALWAFIVALDRGKPWLYAVALLCYALGIMSKEHAILAPLAAIPFYILAARPSGKRLAALSTAGAVLVAIAAFILWKRYGEIIGKPFDEYSRVYLAQLSHLQPGADQHAYRLSILNQAWLFFQYGVRWLVPVAEWMSINLRPPFPLKLVSFPQALGAIGYVAIVVGGFWLVLRHRDWRAFIGLTILVPALLFATEFATVWVQDPFVLYRSYLWAIGIPGLVFFIVHGVSARVIAIVGLVLGSFLMWQSLDRVISLATPESAWTDAIRKLSDDPRAVGRWFPYLNRGSAYVEGSQYNLAMRDFEASTALGDMGMGIFNKGALLAAGGKHAEALVAFDAAQRQGYNLYNLPFQRALSLLALGRVPEAYQQFEAARTMNPPSPTRELLLAHLARLEMQMGKPDAAVKDLQQLLKLQPDNREAQQLLPMALIMKGDAQAARDMLDRRIARQPSGPAYYARALANYELKRKQEALADIDQAIRIGPDNAHLHQWRAKIEALP